MGRDARRQQDHPRPESKSPDSADNSGEEQVAPCCGQRNPSSSAAKRMNEQAAGAVRQNSARKCTTKTSQLPKPAPNDAPHNMPLRQLSGWGLTLETGLARAFGNLPAAALRSAPPKADTIRTAWPLLRRRHGPQMPQHRHSAVSLKFFSWKERAFARQVRRMFAWSENHGLENIGSVCH